MGAYDRGTCHSRPRTVAQRSRSQVCLTTPKGYLRFRVRSVTITLSYIDRFLKKLGGKGQYVYMFIPPPDSLVVKASASGAGGRRFEPYLGLF